MIRTYRELIKFKTFEERYEYLKLKGDVGRATFGFDRYLNQMLYRSKRWLSVRDEIIIRDGGFDLAVPGYDVISRIVIHHMNPLLPEDIEDENELIFDKEFLICTSFRTHLAIHYGDNSLLVKAPIIRRPGDTTLW